jgi:hypothetical protein
MLVPMQPRRVLPVLALVAGAALAVAPDTRAQDIPDLTDQPTTQPEKATDESTEEYLKALEFQRKGRFQGAQKALQKVLKKYPDSVHKEDILLRSGWEDTENHYAGVEVLHESGPPGRRVDVSVMGDGFTVASKDQKLQRKWAKLCLDVLFSEKSFDAYRNYFNYYFVRLVSEDEKVDPNLTDAQRAKIDEKNKKRAKKRKYDYITALDCKAAGPQGQVMADRGKVYHWLGVASRDVPGCADDGQVIAFARFGKLGMGGGGVANVGRPDKAITVHEFGHSFVGLLDEYTNNPMKPRWAIRAPNATSDLEDIPWQHFLDAKVKGVEVIEGGATYVKGVWRPAKSCAMNAGGATGYCPVCREASVLAIYRYVSPIDTSSPPATTELKVVEGDETVLAVTPMQPTTHDLDVAWTVEMVAEGEGDDEADEAGSGTTDEGFPWLGGGGGPGGGPRWNRGMRSRQDRSHLDEPPPGELSDLGRRAKTKKGEPKRHEFPVGDLPPGRYRVTVTVKDPCKWVLKDEKHLLEDRETWTVTVAPQPR